MQRRRQQNRARDCAKALRGDEGHRSVPTKSPNREHSSGYGGGPSGYQRQRGLLLGACGFLAATPKPATAACEILLVNANGHQTSATTSHDELPEPHSGAANRVRP